MEQKYIDTITAILQLQEHNPFAGIDSSEYPAVMAAHREAHPVSIRLNPYKTFQPEQAYERVPWCGYGYYLPERPVFTLDPLFHAGAYYVQEASSMFVGHVYDYIREACTGPVKVLDLCAAPGGKSTLLASLLTADDILVSNEVIQGRAGILVENMTRWGQANTWVVQNDPEMIGKSLENTFDILLVDAPCTGSGLWRKDQGAIDEWSVQHVKLCAERQKRIIADSYAALKQDGYLVYATCSYSPEEDEAICDWITDHFDVTPVSIPFPPEWNIVKSYSSAHQAEGYHFYPWKLKGEGFFIAVFKKNDGIASPTDRKPRKKRTSKKPFVPSPAWEQYIDGSWHYELIGEEVYAFSPQHYNFFEQIRDKVYIKKAGLKLGQEAGKDIIPSHELALSIHLRKDLPAVALTREEALLFLKKEPVATDRGLKGWHTATYRGLPLGWGKWMPGRMNNYLPKHWRIRMDIG